MSGIEIAGLVLGSFPIILNCLDYYRQGFEPLEEWWNFRTHFIAFIDDISHQMMRYNENMIRLLDPIIADSDSLTALVRDAKDPRWTDGSLISPLGQRLASEHGRFLRVVKRMEEVVADLKKLLRIKEGEVYWVGSEEGRPWEWHLKRVQLSFSKGKNKKVKKLATHNQELQEILGYSERIIPITDARKSSHPVAQFEKIRQHACSVHNALRLHYSKCSSQGCRSHQAHVILRGQPKVTSLNVLFVLDEKQESYSKSTKREVDIQPAEDAAEPPAAAMPLSDVQQAASFREIQSRFEDTKPTKHRWSLSKLRFKAHKDTSSASSLADGKAKHTSKHGKRAHFAVPTPAKATSNHTNLHIPSATNIVRKHGSHQYIADLCSYLRNRPQSGFGVILDEYDRQFRLSTPSSPWIPTTPDTARLIPLPELLDAHDRECLSISRQHRFGMAVHIASALLQIQTSPWLSTKWSKHDFYFVADSNNLYSEHPYICQTFVSRVTISPMERKNSSTVLPSIVPEEENTRASLFTVGVIILELIFGHNIESCGFRHLYYGMKKEPDDHTDISTAREWARKVLGECGVEISDVVRRCLDCSFGPRPSLRDKRFREAVYEGVIKPLTDYLKIWQPVMP